MGGLAGGLFGLFNSVGRLLLTALVGPRLARRSWRWLAVTIGGSLTLAAIGGLFAYFSPSSIPSIGGGIALGAICGFTFGYILIIYVNLVETFDRHRKVDSAGDRAKAAQASESTWGEKFDEAYKDRKAQGEQWERRIRTVLQPEDQKKDPPRQGQN